MTETAWTEIRPATGLLGSFDLPETWEYRHVALILVRRQLKVRYKQTVIGVAWVVIQPLVTVLVFTIIFGHIAHLRSDGVPYPVFVVTGVVLWNYIAATVQGATQRLVDERDLITKIYFPRVLAPLASALTPLVDLAVGLVITFVLMAAYAVTPSIGILLLPLWVLGAIVVALSVGMLFGALHVQFRDVGQVLAFAIQIWLFTSPIVFASTAVHGAARVILSLNPVTGLIDGLRYSLLSAPPPPAVDLLSLATGLLVAMTGLVYFHRVERRFADLV